MNVDTGEIKELHDLSKAEIEADFWQRVPSNLNNKAYKYRTEGVMVPLDSKCKLAKFARAKRDSPKGNISKKRFKDLKRELKDDN